MAKTTTNRRKRLQAARQSSLPRPKPLQASVLFGDSINSGIDAEVERRVRARLIVNWHRTIEVATESLRALNQAFEKGLAEMRTDIASQNSQESSARKENT